MDSPWIYKDLYTSDLRWNYDGFNLREFVLTHVILAPGACGRGGPSSGPWRQFRGKRGSGGSGGSVQNRANSLCFTAAVTRVTLRCNVFF